VQNKETDNHLNHVIALEELRDRIDWLIRYRWIAVLCLFLTILLAPEIIDIKLDRKPLLIVASLLGIYNFITWGVVKWTIVGQQKAASASYLANLQITIDLVILTLILHYSGGAENPFAFYYVFHVVIASILLSRRAAYFQTGLAILLFSSMVTLEGLSIIKHFHVDGLGASEHCNSEVYISIIVFCVSTTLAFCAFMATSIAARLRRREDELLQVSESLKNYSDDLTKAYDSLRQIGKHQSDYLNRVAHHLRSPLASSESILAVISEGRTGVIPEKSRELIERTRIRIKETLQLARDLLLLSRAQSLTPEASHKPLELGAVLKGIKDDLTSQASTASVILRMEIPAGEYHLKGDMESLIDLVDNLVSNAIKYTPEGGSIDIALGKEAGKIILSVTDTGIGIPEEEREKVFEEFYRAENAREGKEEGTGLGLSIVKTIADAHKATIEISDNTKQNGTVFRIAFPQEKR